MKKIGRSRLERIAGEICMSVWSKAKQGEISSDKIAQEGIRRGIELCREALGDKASKLDTVLRELEEHE